MRRTWPLWAVTSWLAVAGTSGAAVPEAQRLGDRQDSVDLDLRAATAIATGRDGLAVALVRRGGFLVVRRARPGRPFGAARRLPLGANANSPTVAAGAGFAALAWTHFDASFIPGPYAREDPCCRRVRAALLERSGRVTHPRTLSAPMANVSRVFATVRGGRTALAWIDARGVRTSAGVRRVGFRRPATITTSQTRGLLGVALPRATPHVFFVVGYRRPRMVEAWRAGGHTRRRTLGRFVLDPFDARAAVTPAGRLLLASVRRRAGGRRRLVVLSHRPGASLRNVSVPVPRTAATAVALASSGRGLVATADDRGLVTLRSVDRFGRVGHARSTPAPRRLGDMAIAIAPSGAGVLAASARTGSLQTERTHVVAWRLGRGGRLGSQRDVTARVNGVSGLAATFDRRLAWVSFPQEATYAALVR